MASPSAYSLHNVRTEETSISSYIRDAFRVGIMAEKTVEMEISDVKNYQGLAHHHVRARLHSYRLNYASEHIHQKPVIRIRKNQGKMTQAERDRYTSAVQSLISSGLLGPLVAIHGVMSHRMHSSMGPIGTQRFLPWHRIYLFELEQMLQTHDPQLTIPYWDWAVDRSVPAWLQGFTPTVWVNGNPISVFRQPGVLLQNLPAQLDVDKVEAQTSFTSFTQPVPQPPFGLEGLHNDVHVWVGGTMASIPTAPADPVFWLHHANVDRLWDMWQKKNPNKNPNITGPDAVLDPWSYSEVDTRDTKNFGYKYV